MSLLLNQVEYHNTHTMAQRQFRDGVWTALEAEHPTLAAELTRQFGTPDAAARWLLAAGPSRRQSPARLIAEGREYVVREALHRYLYAFPP